MTGRLYPDGSRVTFAYDALGNRTQMAGPTGTSTYSYDTLGRVQSVIDPAGKRTTYAYDAAGQRASLVNPDGGRATFTFDPAGRVYYVLNPQGDRTTFTYDAAGRRTLEQLANGTRASQTYDAADRLTWRANLKADDSLVSSFNYNYDNADNRTGMLEGAGGRVTWTYDATNQLTNERRTVDNAYNTTFVYDPVGNRLVKNADGSLTTYTYDAANQLQTSRDASGVTTYTFDASGNQQVVQLPTGARTTNTWDCENRLTRVEPPEGAVNTMSYDPDGLRVEKQDSSGTHKYLWDGQILLLEYDAAGAIQAVYTHEPAIYGGLVSACRKNGAVWVPIYHHYDGLGSTRQLTDAAGQTTDTYLYEAYGQLVQSTGTSVVPYHFVGRSGYYFDEELAEYYIRARHYDPRLARWLAVDPIGAGINPYRYVGNMPLTAVDPFGLATVVFKPDDVAGMAWTECGVFGSEQTEMWAATRACDFKVECKCAQHHCKKGECVAKCEAFIEVALYLSPAMCSKLGKPVDKSYAHEQRHVMSWIQFAIKLKKILEKVEKDSGCQASMTKCKQVAEAGKKFAKERFEEWKKNEQAHSNPPPCPKPNDLSYEPQGTMPAKPTVVIKNCTGTGPCPKAPPPKPNPDDKTRGLNSGCGQGRC